ncbi:sugar transferase [Rhodopirellula europaea]|uniref:Exopolysaccharide biosynthesis polyprenyl glycosylphosphotransferase n=1 Tax=Rhodopirellula europaea 6C TaxID=1263867 RepID=M2AUB2_9BACT|nr:sugar transferase [Rhodopirellula europaea]EMB16307.1 exopolysaccharide biosynthesis polyprenyl glycosylphosphotransferase [Rhodopirellula europaea 6C]
MFSFFKKERRESLLRWKDEASLGRRRVLLLSSRQFDRELNRERLRATRRSIPFCLLTVELLTKAGATRRSTNKQNRQLVDLLLRNLRVTDEKGILATFRYGVLLVDTPEMGGRAVLDRLARLTSAAGLEVRLNLQVHDPNGFGEDQENNQDASGDRRADDRRKDDPADSEEAWVRLASTTAESTAPTEPSALSHNRVQSSIDDITLAGVQQQSSQSGLWLKRGIDVVGAGIGLVLTGPAILGAMAAIKLTDGGPVFFRQTREGQNGRPFTILKLRTMIVDAEKFQAELRAESHRDGPAFKISRDPRVTKVGHFLRATCLDELPQLINVLTGDMSLVGPRPLPWHESRACERWHRRRLDVRPGLTCTWQVNKAKAVTFDDWMRMDLRYIDQLGLFQDLRLIAQTVVVPVTGRGGE